jgi:hypothetical protein
VQLVLSGRTVSPAIKENDQKEGVDRYRPEGMAELCKVRQPPDAKRHGSSGDKEQPNPVPSLHCEPQTPGYAIESPNSFGTLSQVFLRRLVAAVVCLSLYLF